MRELHNDYMYVHNHEMIELVLPLYLCRNVDTGYTYIVHVHVHHNDYFMQP